MASTASPVRINLAGRAPVPESKTVLMRSVAAVILALFLTAAGQEHGDSPWFGTWALRAEDAGDQPETLIYSDAGNGAMRMESVEAQSVIVTRFDGEPVRDSGPGDSGNALPTFAL